MFLLEQLLPAVPLAAAVAAVVSALALRGTSKHVSRVLAGCAVGAGYFAGHVWITDWTVFPPTDTTNWLPYFVLAAAAIGSLDFLLKSKAARIAVLGLVCVGAMRLLLAPKFRYGWSAEQGWLWVGGLAVILTLRLAATARRSLIAMELPLLLAIVSAGTTGALMLSGSLLLGQFAAVLSAAVLGGLVSAWRGRFVGDGVAPVFSLVGVALLASGYFFAELPALSAVLLATALVCGADPHRDLSATMGSRSARGRGRRDRKRRDAGGVQLVSAVERVKRWAMFPLSCRSPLPARRRVCPGSRRWQALRLRLRGI